MRTSLDRILRIRQLQEETIQLEFQTLASEIHRLESAAAGQRQLGRKTHQAALLSLIRSEWDERPTESSNWLMAMGDAAIFQQRCERLGALAETRQPAAEEARQQLLTRRVERRQIEAVMAIAAAAEQKSRTRREQKHLDDWFQTMNLRRSRSDRARR
jgi:flagellar biosynthesis chaperone FliJ